MGGVTFAGEAGEVDVQQGQRPSHHRWRSLTTVSSGFMSSKLAADVSMTAGDQKNQQVSLLTSVSLLLLDWLLTGGQAAGQWRGGCRWVLNPGAEAGAAAEEAHTRPVLPFSHESQPFCSIWRRRGGPPADVVVKSR